MKKFLNKKILLTVLLFFILLIYNSVSVLAYDCDTDYIISNYNNEWIDSYLDLNMNPTDGIKSFIDKHQDYFNFKSEDLGTYWVCEKLNDTTNDCYFYYFIFAPGPLYIRYHYNGSASATGVARKL